MKIACFVVFFMALFLAIKKGHCSAWLVGPGKTQIISDMVIGSQKELLVTGGHTENDINFQISQLYIERGIVDGWSMGLSSMGGIYTKTDIITDDTTTGFGIQLIELFLKKSLIKRDNFILTLQLLTKQSGVFSNETFNYALNGTPANRDYETRLQAGWGISGSKGFGGLFGTKHNFINFESAYRFRENLDFNEIRLEFTYGFQIFRAIAFLLTYQKIIFHFPGGSDSFLDIITSKNDMNRISAELVLRESKNIAYAIKFNVDTDVPEFLGTSDYNIGYMGIEFGVWLDF